MNRRLNLGLRATALLLAICAFVSLNPFFLWSTYNNGMFYSGDFSISTLLTLLCVFFSFFCLKKDWLKKKHFCVATVTLILGIWCCFLSGIDRVFVIPRIIPFALIIAFQFINDDVLSKSLKYLSTILAIFFVVGLITLFLLLVGIEVPHDILISINPEKVSIGQYYNHYFGSVIINDSSKGLFRFCGIFDEPGLTGTICALILINYKFRMNRWQNVVLLISGIASLSAAFFFLSFIYLFYRLLISKKIKQIVFLCAILAIYFLFINWKVENNAINYLQNRLNFSGDWDNRTNAAFENEFSIFLNSSLLLVGNGYMTASSNQYLAGNSSYKFLIYDYGIIGFILIIIFFLAVLFSRFSKDERKASFIIIVCFIMSIYQRPYVFNSHYMLIFFSGLALSKIDATRKNRGVLR